MPGGRHRDAQAELPGDWLLSVKDGRIASMYEFADTALIERAMFDKKVVPAEKCPQIPR